MKVPIGIGVLAAALAVAAPGAGYAQEQEAEAFQSGTIWELPHEYFLLVVKIEEGEKRAFEEKSDDGKRFPFSIKVRERFVIPEGIMLETDLFQNRKAIEGYLLRQYLAALKYPETTGASILQESATSCEEGIAGYTGVVLRGARPVLEMAYPQSGSIMAPIAVVGTNIMEHTTPYVNGVPAARIKGLTKQTIPLVGEVAAGFTVVAPGTPKGEGTMKLKNCAEESQEISFEVK